MHFDLMNQYNLQTCAEGPGWATIWLSIVQQRFEGMIPSWRLLAVFCLGTVLGILVGQSTAPSFQLFYHRPPWLTGSTNINQSEGFGVSCNPSAGERCGSSKDEEPLLAASGDGQGTTETERSAEIGLPPERRCEAVFPLPIEELEAPPDRCEVRRCQPRYFIATNVTFVKGVFRIPVLPTYNSSTRQLLDAFVSYWQNLENGETGDRVQLRHLQQSSPVHESSPFLSSCPLTVDIMYIPSWYFDPSNYGHLIVDNLYGLHRAQELVQFAEQKRGCFPVLPDENDAGGRSPSNRTRASRSSSSQNMRGTAAVFLAEPDWKHFLPESLLEETGRVALQVSLLRDPRNIDDNNRIIFQERNLPTGTCIRRAVFVAFSHCGYPSDDSDPPESISCIRSLRRFQCKMLSLGRQRVSGVRGDLIPERQEALPAATRKSCRWKAVWLSRPPETRRRILNEDSLVAELEDRLGPHHASGPGLCIERVRLGEIPTADEVRIMQRADVFFLVSGAGAASMVYMRRGTVVVHVRPWGFQQYTDFATIWRVWAARLGLQMFDVMLAREQTHPLTPGADLPPDGAGYANLQVNVEVDPVSAETWLRHAVLLLEQQFPVSLQQRPREEMQTCHWEPWF